MNKEIKAALARTASSNNIGSQNLLYSQYNVNHSFRQIGDPVNLVLRNLRLEAFKAKKAH